MRTQMQRKGSTPERSFRFQSFQLFRVRKKIVWQSRSCLEICSKSYIWGWRISGLFELAIGLNKMVLENIFTPSTISFIALVLPYKFLKKVNH
ncbi:MAG: hypothetical protein DI551_05010 [Micavibrio aeruginosavorus]|uniref:Uncharacterized protein n=1 Tax=Micavibrio aeruginosavorus TaxID=349221 RepID=A0A2W5MZ51_9BACT|nr:MAG: hypothetical protein DI551_05010 [Micavibrio aeruginosavorus]